MSDQMFGLVSCETCRYAVTQSPLLAKAAMQCRRHPPIPVPVQQNGTIGSMNIWPLVTKGDSCGDGLPKMLPLQLGEASPLPHLSVGGA